LAAFSVMAWVLKLCYVPLRASAARCCGLLLHSQCSFFFSKRRISFPVLIFSLPSFPLFSHPRGFPPNERPLFLQHPLFPFSWCCFEFSVLFFFFPRTIPGVLGLRRRVWTLLEAHPPYFRCVGVSPQLRRPPAPSPPLFP